MGPDEDVTYHIGPYSYVEGEDLQGMRGSAS